ncbi:MAG: hypothetical protein ACPGYV_02360 [Phycisphaeraceae bacterium]
MTTALPDHELIAPAWLDTICPPTQPVQAAGDDAIERSAQSGMLRLKATLPECRHLDAIALEEAVDRLYRTLFDLLEESEHAHLLRIWNGVPGILDPMQLPTPALSRWERVAPTHEPFDRYMAFNAGRSQAFRRWTRGTQQPPTICPAATAVGHRGTDLQVHLLASDRPGIAYENPRQTPAYNYSPRYGPYPPIFARATRYEERLFISGTASVVGEKSMHADQLEPQLNETVNNLRCIAQQAGEDATTLRHFRAYATDEQDLPVIAETLHQHFPNIRSLEWMRADLCRPDLRVEIEATT